MKLLFIIGALVATLANARVVLSPDPAPRYLPRDVGLNNSLNDDVFAGVTEPSTVHTNANPSKFDKAAEIGRTLDSAMKSKDSIARWFFKGFPNFHGTCQSPFEGDGREELSKWGFDDSEELSKEVEKDCDFEKFHHIEAAFQELGLETKAAKDGGPNKCFKINHRDGPAIKRLPDGSLPSKANQYYDVCGKEYRATGATYEFAVNPKGLVALMNIMSMTYCAEKFTWFRKPLPGELPHIGTPSDIAWATWNRAGASDIKDINYLLVTQVMNAGSREIFTSALKTLEPPESEYKIWPGHEFSMDTNGGRAILGSPVGRWAGYFLLQHKKKLGGNRFISKVRLFKPADAALPYLVFYVDPTPAGGGSTANAAPRALGAAEIGLRNFDEKITSRLVKKSIDGRDFIREHAIYNHS